MKIVRRNVEICKRKSFGEQSLNLIFCILAGRPKHRHRKLPTRSEIIDEKNY